MSRGLSKRRKSDSSKIQVLEIQKLMSQILWLTESIFLEPDGVRIKTWQGGYGSASNIKFQNVKMHNVQNPIIINQNYCDQDEPCKQQNSSVQIKNVMYENIKGTSATDVAINFDCSKSNPCREIVLHDVNLVGADGGKSKAVCKNADLKGIGTVLPHCP